MGTTDQQAQPSQARAFKVGRTLLTLALLVWMVVVAYSFGAGLISVSFRATTAVLLVCLLGALVGFLLEVVRLRAAGTNPFRAKSFGAAVVTCFLLGISSFFFGEIGPAIQLAECGDNLKQMSVVLAMAANETPANTYPELSATGRLSIRNELPGNKAVYPEYLTDLSRLYGLDRESRKQWAAYKDCPIPQEVFDHSSFIYLGYAISNEAELDAFAHAYRQHVAQRQQFKENLNVTSGLGNKGGSEVFRLKKDVARLLVDHRGDEKEVWVSAAKIPVLIERRSHAMPLLHNYCLGMKSGVHVLFMDGSIRFVPYGEWPVTQRALEILKSLEEKP